MSALGDLGPVLRSRGDLRPIAIEAHQLALILLDTTAEGGDVARANRTLRRLQAVVGGGDYLERAPAGVRDGLGAGQTNEGD